MSWDFCLGSNWALIYIYIYYIILKFWGIIFFFNYGRNFYWAITYRKESKIQMDRIYWDYRYPALPAFVSPDNINGAFWGKLWKSNSERKPQGFRLESRSNRQQATGNSEAGKHEAHSINHWYSSPLHFQILKLFANFLTYSLKMELYLYNNIYIGIIQGSVVHCCESWDGDTSLRLRQRNTQRRTTQAMSPSITLLSVLSLHREGRFWFWFFWVLGFLEKLWKLCAFCCW